MRQKWCAKTRRRFEQTLPKFEQAIVEHGGIKSNGKIDEGELTMIAHKHLFW